MLYLRGGKVDATPKEPMMTVREVAEYLRMDERYIYRLVAAGAIPHYRVSARTIRFKRVDIDDWMEKVCVGSATNLSGTAPDA